MSMIVSEDDVSVHPSGLLVSTDRKTIECSEGCVQILGYR